MITNENIQRLKESVNIVDLISRYIEVHKSGSNYTCVCPFHDDKNPSMAINEQDGFYHCFACKAHGDIISFVQNYKHLSFIESVEEIAKMYNFELEGKKLPIRQNNALLTLNEYYVSELNYRQDLITYLEKRKITRDLRVKFSIGYAPSAKNTINVLNKAQIKPETALKQGVVKHNENGLYPSFIDRITFPIYDHTGFLVGFGGRTLNPNNPAKYVNSPASKLFDKKSIFYGFHLAKMQIAKHKKIIICEGYMDTISLHKAGIGYAVAVLGTALGENHLKLIKKDYLISLCFDKDDAGLNATFKAALLLSQKGYNAEIITLKSYKDPGEYIENNEEEKLLKELENTENAVYFCIEYIFKNELKTKYLDKLSIKNTNPFIVKNAYAKVIEYTDKIDKFISQAYLNVFCEKYNLDFNLISKAKPEKLMQKSAKTNLENSILFFLINCRIDISILILPEFFTSDILDLALKKDLKDPKIIEFLAQINEVCKEKDPLKFLQNLAMFYWKNNIKNANIFRELNIILKKNEKAIKKNAKVNVAFDILCDLIGIYLGEVPSENLPKIKEKMIYLENL